MEPITGTLEDTLRAIPSDELEDLVVVEASPEFPGQLIYQPLVEPQSFWERYREWLSEYLVVNELFQSRALTEILEADGYRVVFAPNTAEILEDYHRWEQPLEIEGYNLHAFQSFSLNRALERAENRNSTDRLYFWNWSTGSGKGYCSPAGAKVLFERGMIDLVISCTLSKLKENVRREYVDRAGIKAVVNDGTTAQRTRGYQDPGVECFVMNYEKLRVDEKQITELVKGKRVLWVLDECHRLLTEDEPNKARRAFNRILRHCTPTVWPMSATVVGSNPLRFRDVFDLDGDRLVNPLGTREQFLDRYADHVKDVRARTHTGRSFTFTAYDWRLHELQEIRHRVGGATMAIRKTDPGVREQFKGLETIPVMVQAPPGARRLNEIIVAYAREAKNRDESLAPYYLMLRLAAINPAVLALSQNPIAQQIAADHPTLMDARHSPKYEVVNDTLQSIRESEDKVVMFCHWTNLGLLPLAEHIKVPHVLHHGAQTARESQEAQDRFKTDPDITCFATSDAGTHGLNMQVARYCLSVDPTYSFDDLSQRGARIDRADSHLDGLTHEVLVVEESVEHRVWRICNERRVLASAVQGTSETLSYGQGARVLRDESVTTPPPKESMDLDFLIFGEEY